MNKSQISETNVLIYISRSFVYLFFQSPTGLRKGRGLKSRKPGALRGRRVEGLAQASTFYRGVSKRLGCVRVCLFVCLFRGIHIRRLVADSISEKDEMTQVNKGCEEGKGGATRFLDSILESGNRSELKANLLIFAPGIAFAWSVFGTVNCCWYSLNLSSDLRITARRNLESF